MFTWWTISQSHITALWVWSFFFKLQHVWLFREFPTHISGGVLLLLVIESVKRHRHSYPAKAARQSSREASMEHIITEKGLLIILYLIYIKEEYHNKLPLVIFDKYYTKKNTLLQPGQMCVLSEDSVRVFKQLSKWMKISHTFTFPTFPYILKK